MNRKYPSFTIIVSFAALVLCGISLVRLLNIQLNPSSSPSSFTISYSWPDAGARVVEQEVTSRLEALCAGVKGVKDISSKSENGRGYIRISLDKKADADAIRFEISTLVRQAWPNLPEGVSYPQLGVNRSDDKEDTPLVSYSLNAPASPFMIQKYAEDYIKPRLSQIPGIYKTEVYGASPMEWQIVYDAQKLEALLITPGDIQNAILLHLKKENIGISDESLPVVLKSDNPSSGDKLFSSLPILQTNGHTIFLHDIARVVHREAQPQSYYRINGLNTINVVVYAAAGENNLVLCESVKETLTRLSGSFPKGYKLLPGYDSTEYIRNELHNIGLRTLFTFLILLLFVFAVTRTLKHVLMILVVLVANLGIAVIFYYLFRIEIHLYALAGITVSFGLMTDNIIIMSDHLRTRGNRKAWLAIFAGTLATISALAIIFFLDERVRINLTDFALVIIINQSVSLLTALFLIPALMDVLKLGKMQGPTSLHRPARKRMRFNVMGHRRKGSRIVKFTGYYQKAYLFIRRRKFIPLAVLILGFGLPVFLLPDTWEGERWYNKAYNSTLGCGWYNDNARPWVNKIMGGSLRLFTEYVFEGSYFGNPQETSLYITASMPNGTTVQQMNAVAGIMESYLRQFSEIRTFETNISTRQASITVYFKKQFQSTGFPYRLKSEVISKAIGLGGADWGVFGFGDGFSNDIHESAGNYHIEMLGYNYDRLNELAGALKKQLKQNLRVKEVYLLPEITWYKPDNSEFAVRMDAAKAAISGIVPGELYASLQHAALQSNFFATAYPGGTAENIRLSSLQAAETDIWQLERIPLLRDSVLYKFTDFCSVTKESAAPSVCKENQQYRLYLQFDYIGADKFARKYIDNTLLNFKPRLPLGYSADTGNNNWYWYWGKQDKKQYWLLALIIVMIFFICAVLFESLLQPFAVILTIPVAYIGIFLTFYLFDLNFDQGGFAAFVMLSGITVNASIYILNDFNNLKRHHKGHRIPVIKMYLRAFNYKIIPILLTIVATVLGFVPFLTGEKQPFWFTLAAGAIGGLVFSLVGILIYLPLFLGIGKRWKMED